MKMEFYRCPVCGNIVSFVKNCGVPVFCCGKPMVKLEANTTEAATEKHLPVVSVKNGVVNVAVGSVSHPMTEEHYIEFIALETTKGCLFHKLSPNDKPEATFALASGEKVLSAYAYCNLHSLWKTSV